MYFTFKPHLISGQIWSNTVVHMWSLFDRKQIQFKYKFSCSVEGCNFPNPTYSTKERNVLEHFKKNHNRNETRRFVVPLPRRPNITALGESRSIAVKCFRTVERSLESSERSWDFATAVWEYFDMDHVKPVPALDTAKPLEEIYYMPMHMGVKASSSTCQMRVVFDASAKTGSGTSLNDHLIVGPTLHALLVDVLLRFLWHKIAMVTDISKIYPAVLLPADQWELHRSVWKNNSRHPFVDYRMKRLTFGVSASSFAANMVVKQNANNNAEKYPLASRAVFESFYVDDGLTGPVRACSRWRRTMSETRRVTFINFQQQASHDKLITTWDNYSNEW